MFAPKPISRRTVAARLFVALVTSINCSASLAQQAQEPAFLSPVQEQTQAPSFLNAAQTLSQNLVNTVSAVAAPTVMASTAEVPQSLLMTPSYTTYLTGEGPQGESNTPSNPTGKQNGNGIKLPITSYSLLSQAGGPLPPTSLDSFVYEAGGMANLIYGDEGTDGPPPYYEFDQTHRINAGIFGIDNAGLTTGHGSLLPNAWGGDEFVKTEPFTMSGAQGFSFDLGGISVSFGP